jgi:hypothetical protein
MICHATQLILPGAKFFQGNPDYITLLFSLCARADIIPSDRMIDWTQSRHPRRYSEQDDDPYRDSGFDLWQWTFRFHFRDSDCA